MTADKLRVQAGADVLEFLVELRYYMRRNGISQSELSRRVGVSRHQMSRWLHKADGLTAKSMFLLARGVGNPLSPWERR